MIFHENRLLADDSHVRKLGKMLHNLSSAEVVIGALRVKNVHTRKKTLKIDIHFKLYWISSS